MVAHWHSVVSVFFLVARGSAGPCSMGNSTHQVGDVWKEEWECVGHTCQEDGTYTTDVCLPLPEDIPAYFVMKEETPASNSFPDCCARVHPPPPPCCKRPPFSGCNTADNRTIQYGDQYDVPGKCQRNLCRSNNTWTTEECKTPKIPPGWKPSPVDYTKGYPDCCSRAIPPLQIVPDVMNDLQWNGFLEVSYPDDIKVSMGNTLSPIDVIDEPTVSYRSLPKAYYLLCMIDPDIPSRKERTDKEFLHWMVGNIPEGNVDAGETIAEYVEPNPKKGSGKHRYVFLVYKQPGILTFDEPEVADSQTPGIFQVADTPDPNRIKFSIGEFSQKYNLTFPRMNVFQSYYDQLKAALDSIKITVISRN